MCKIGCFAEKLRFEEIFEDIDKIFQPGRVLIRQVTTHNSHGGILLFFVFVETIMKKIGGEKWQKK